MPRILLLLLGLAGLSSPAIAAEPFAFKDGDRVVMIGGAFIEREAESGTIETLLTIQNPDKNITFRNLGWSGDTVAGIARARFGTPEDGFQHLKAHVLALKPTVIFVAYGMTESFEGEKGLPEFERGLNRVLDMLAETRARIVLISPIRHEPSSPLPDPSKHNVSLESYVGTLRKTAESRQYPFVDLFNRTWPANLATLTDNGLHPTPSGYLTLGHAIIDSLGPQARSRSADLGLALDESGRITALKRGDVELTMPAIAKAGPTSGGVRFEATAPSLPMPYNAPPDPGRVAGSPSPKYLLRLPPGRSALKVDGRPTPIVASPSMPDVVEMADPDYARTEELRRTIVAKNRLYFHRWRPQNETYLFGFRKHEQGQNAREIPLFDPLVDEKEKEIARLKVPVAHTFEIVREPDPGK